MIGYNVIVGKQPIKDIQVTIDDPDKPGEKKTVTRYLSSGYVKSFPPRGRLLGIEFSGYDGNTGKNPDCAFDYVLFSSESAWIKYAKERGLDLPSKMNDKAKPVSNPALYVISADTYRYDNPLYHRDYPQNVGFRAATYTDEPMPYSNVDAVVNPDYMQYPLYLFVEFVNNPGIKELDYKVIVES